MPKKRKARRPNVPLQTGPVPLNAPPAAAPAPASARRAAAPAATRAPASQINADYTHVVGDLRRIAILGGGLIGVLILLSFFIK